MIQIQPVILAGGTGTRLWPMSRELHPKQLLKLGGSGSLLQETYRRLVDLDGALPPILVVGEEHRFTARDQILQMGAGHPSAILLEPLGRNTAPATAAAAVHARENLGGDTVLLVLPADHLIKDAAAFRAAVAEAAVLAQAGRLVTFGIRPLYPETGYGYIKKGEGERVLGFVEKPDLETAKGYLAQGNYFWNSGMLAFTADAILAELKRHDPKIVECMEEAMARGAVDPPFYRLERAAMERCPSDSIDYAVLEKSSTVAVVVPADMGWSDVGSWQAVWEVSDKDRHGNALSGDVLCEDVSNSLIRTERGLVAAVGLSNMLVVETDDAVLVAPLSRSQDVKKIVQRLKADKREESLLHRTVSRPWGTYTILEEQANFKIKRITVSPGVKLSLQMHHHRSEHWVVVRGTARVTCGDKVYLVRENESTYIPCGERHRLENPGVIPLELIEVQNGSYLGEDDIVRFDDDFGRDAMKTGKG